jgi:hypothetical protein
VELQNGNAFVRVKSPSGVHAQPVRLRTQDGQITDGLKEGDVVVY